MIESQYRFAGRQAMISASSGSGAVCGNLQNALVTVCIPGFLFIYFTIFLFIIQEEKKDDRT